MKKLLLFMLGVFVALPGIARDFTYEYEGQTLTYTVIDEDDRTCKTKDGDSDSYRPGNVVIEKSLVIPSVAKDGDIEYAVTEIGDAAFSLCATVTSVYIPESVTKIGNYAFYSWYGLTSVNIPESVTEIGEGAFKSCSSLTSVNIPESVTEIGNAAFSGCSRLTSVNIPEAVTKIGEYTFSGCSLTSVNIPESVTEIGNAAFYWCSRLTSVNIPESVTEIGDEAFYWCSSLTSVKIPEAVTKIGYEAFYGCSSLTSVKIPEAVTKIGKWAFRSCESLSSIVFLPRDCELGDNVFFNDSNIKKVAAYDSSLFKSGGVFSSASIKWLIEDDVTFDAEKGILWSADNKQCFVMTDYTGSLIMPDGMTQLNSIPFSYCENLTDVQLPATLETIGTQVFMNTAVKEVVIPNRVSTVDKDAFQNADLVKGAYPDVFESPFDESVVAIEYDAVDSKITDNFVYSRRGDKLHYAPLSITPEFEISETVTEITDKAFSKCEALTKITLPEKLSTLGNSVWEDCTNLTAIVCHNPEPVVAERDVFHVNVYKDATLYVPKGSKEKYESTKPWSYFYNIIEEEAAAIDDVMSEAADAIDYTLPVEVYNLQGVMVAESIENLPAGLYIVRQGKNVKKIIVK